MSDFNHHTDSYILYLRAQNLAEACHNVYQSISRGENKTYHLKEAQEYLDMVQVMLNDLKGEIK